MPKIQGEIFLPGDKSISHRAALFSALRSGTSKFENFNFNQDCSSTLNCLKALGVEWKFDGKTLQVMGKSLRDWQKPGTELNAQNSGTTARLLSGLLIHLPFETVLIGDASLSRRPMKRILGPLRLMGGNIKDTDEHLPLHFFPSQKIHGITYRLPVASAQVKSAVLLAGLFAEGETVVIEKTPTRDHTERLLNLPIRFDQSGLKIIKSSRQIIIPDISMTIPGDFSSAAFFIAAALLVPHSDLVIRNVSLNPTRTGLLEILKKMGIKLQTQKTQDEPEPMGDIHVQSQLFKNITVPEELIPNIIDEIPVLSILATQGEGRLIVHNAAELRVKESDRIKAIVTNLRALGVEIEEFEDGFAIEGPQAIQGGRVITYGDHRIAMSFAIAGLIARNPIKLDDAGCVSVSFPQFFDLLKQITVG